MWDPKRLEKQGTHPALPFLVRGTPVSGKSPPGADQGDGMMLATQSHLLSLFVQLFSWFLFHLIAKLS